MAQTLGRRVPQLQPHLRQRQRHEVRLLRAGRHRRTCYAGRDVVGNSAFINIGTSGSYGYGTAGAKCGDYVTLYVDCHTTQP